MCNQVVKLIAAVATITDQLGVPAYSLAEIDAELPALLLCRFKNTKPAITYNAQQCSTGLQQVRLSKLKSLHCLGWSQSESL